MTLPSHFQATPWSGDSGLGWPGVLEVAHLVMPQSCGVSVMSSLHQKMSKWLGGVVEDQDCSERARTGPRRCPSFTTTLHRVQVVAHHEDVSVSLWRGARKSWGGW